MEDRPSNILDKACREEWLATQIRVGIAMQIRSLRIARGWTQADLAARCGMHQEQISNLEDPNRRRDPSINTLKRIGIAFDCAFLVRFAPWSALLTGEPFDWQGHVPSFEEEFGAAP